ncbi:DNA cytosine methyltransferase [uncultured Thiothrix sp.]|uniref:DNA cytosine methyltransferase n=1 Tax=uncultured Thiothrix sp. TaxID=223185 RepID=UPI0026257308|nr:DNA (cytosine-5-)-methyltransferase [uncultured Thiothrix sp.]
MSKKIPIIDLFAGPGGLAEGFSSLNNLSREPIFSVKLSIEKDNAAHKTLSLRAAYRHLKQIGTPDSYYDYITGKIDRSSFESLPQIRESMDLAYNEARNATLGETPHQDIDQWIVNSLQNEKDWVLIGGPPCQAYSLMGRSIMRKKDPLAFEKDHRHFLYKEYLRIIEHYKPAIFIMENVKGILSSTHAGNLIFEQILSDLSCFNSDVQYELKSFVVDNSEGKKIIPKDFTIYTERHGIPQARHRVIVLGIRKDFSYKNLPTLDMQAAPTVAQAIGDLPKIRSCLSKQQDSYELWKEALKGTLQHLEGWSHTYKKELKEIILDAIKQNQIDPSHGKDFIYGRLDFANMPEHLRTWLEDERLEGVIQHVARSHMATDLQRYLFAASYGSYNNISPKMKQFPKGLLPSHKNVNGEKIPFDDRFRVQIKDTTSTTILSHISKDGHYYIHYDPEQCRSLTLREAARLQTFPDNYYFEGNRTQQYIQVGNAVPPLLAKKLAEVVAGLFNVKGI